MISIPAVQFLRPDGRMRQVRTLIPEELGEQWKAIEECGLRLTLEELSTFEVSISLESAEGDYMCEVVPNGPRVTEVRDMMIRRFDPAAYQEWLARVQ